MYKVIETPMYPNKWKVIGEPPIRDDNAGCNFFKDYSDAQAKCDILNEQLRKKEKENV